MGNGEFIIVLNSDLRKKIKKNEGAILNIRFELDKSKALISNELVSCLNDDEIAKKQFLSLLPSHQNYYHRYIETAKTQATKATRIAHTLNAMHKKLNYGEMIRSLKK
jgi:uncharacterized protein YdeI (YjbR/CyaY-like superfamily)